MSLTLFPIAVVSFYTFLVFLCGVFIGRASMRRNSKSTTEEKVTTMGWCDACGWDDGVLYNQLVARGYHVKPVPTKKHL